MVMELIRDQGFREQRGEYGSRVGGGGGGGGGGGNGGQGGGGGDSLDVSVKSSIVRFLSSEMRGLFSNLTFAFILLSFRFLYPGLQWESSLAETEK